MSTVCCREFQGWCRAFTATEVILSLLQTILLTLFVAILTFLILHFIACSDDETSSIGHHGSFTAETLDPSDWLIAQEQTDSSSGSSESEEFSTDSVSSGSSESEEFSTDSVTHYNNTIWPTVSPNVACTWTPSAKTRVVTQYFEHTSINTTDSSTSPLVTLPLYDEFLHTEGYLDGTFVSDQFDGEPANNEKSSIIALVKMQPPGDVMFGCILTIVSEFWTLTAASCIESIEEEDSLDSFVMMENFGEPTHGKTHLVSEVLIHPLYQGNNKTYDIVALKSGDKLTSKDTLLNLPTMLDYLLITIGERLNILGYGKFRSINRDAFARGLHAVAVHVLPSAQCAARGDAWSARHLAGGAPVARARCGAAAICAGPLYARGAPCNYCAGTPLLQARVLLGIMSDPGPCGAPCEPALYVNLAALRDWINSVVGDY